MGRGSETQLHVSTKIILYSLEAVGRGSETQLQVSTKIIFYSLEVVGRGSETQLQVSTKIILYSLEAVGRGSETQLQVSTKIIFYSLEVVGRGSETQLQVSTKIILYSLEAVGRGSETQLQVGENYWYLFNLRPNIWKSWFLNTHFIPNEWMNEWMKSYIAHVSSRRLFRALNIESNLARPVIIQNSNSVSWEIYSWAAIASKFALCAKYSHIVDFLGSRWMETAPTSIEVLLRPTLGQSDEPSDLRVYTATGSSRRSPIQLWTGRDVA